MWEDGTVFACYTSMWDVIYYSELGSSWSVLAAGYTIDSLMLRYQGVDWTNLESWDCNAKYDSSPCLFLTQFKTMSSISSRLHQTAKNELQI